MALASFPFRLQRNSSINLPSPAWGKPLVIGWVAVVIAILTASLLVHGVMRLSERRASFVSAVTHELRTPLTTFRLYSDMLESGAVKPEKRGDYLRVLSREADRLSHLVENVLSFSRIERGSARSVVREAAISDLLETMRERLEARLATAGMTLEMDSSCKLRVRVDSAAVEHILFNLIDNAAKYASSGKPPAVVIKVRKAGGNLEIIVSDHGPGIPVSERRRIFRAFHKSAREAAESRPGVGLGLALSRRLAKSLGGGLECVDSKQGACFVLRLPLA
jgi:signal transduction histidine kinase